MGLRTGFLVGEDEVREAVDEAQENWKKQKGRNEKWYYKVWEDKVEIEEKELEGEEADQVDEGQ